MAKGFKENWESLSTYWNTKKGLVFFFLVFVSIYYGAVSKFIEENLFENKLFRVWLIPFVGLLLIYVVWAFLSHRINFYKRKIITTGIFLKCNDSTSELRIKEIINDLVEELRDEFGEIKFKLFPINYITTKTQLSRFVATNNHIIDNAFFATIYNGNCSENSQTVSKIEIQNIFFSAHLGDNNQSDFKKNINMSHDLSIRNLNKDWQYVESKSFSDKTKIKYNFEDSLLFFNGLYSIYMKEYDLALKIFKRLKSSEDNDINVFSHAKKQRLNEILLGLFNFNAIKKYIDKKDIESAFSLLKECEIIFKENHRFSFNNYLILSRIYFEKGDLNMAKEYTENARGLKRFSPAIHCNLGFFGMVDNNPEQVFQNYRELAHVYRYANNLDFLEIVHFIELHKHKYPDSLHLFDFAIASLNFLYVDKGLGRTQLNNVQEILKSSLTYSKIYDLSNFLLQKGDIKSPYFQRDRKRRAS
jgi:tetratricopeptide (TPR) repeat protein